LVGVRHLPVRNHGILPSQLTAAWRRAGNGRIGAGGRADLHAWAVAELSPVALRAALPVRLQAGTHPGESGSARIHNAAEPTGISPYVTLQNVGGNVLAHPFPLDDLGAAGFLTAHTRHGRVSSHWPAETSQNMLRSSSL
jgi:hypothetical protein